MCHSRCNWLIKDKVLVGAEPTQDTLPKLLTFGVKHFVCLCEPNYTLPEGVTRETVYIKNGGAGNTQVVDSLTSKLADLVKSPNCPLIYIHCVGGHGRTGMIGAILVGKVYGIKACQAIDYVEYARSLREDTSRNFIPTPETNAQVKQVERILGKEPNRELPDRSNKGWMKKR